MNQIIILIIILVALMMIEKGLNERKIRQIQKQVQANQLNESKRQKYLARKYFTSKA
ncbi:hypothetical protein [Enterococcus sp. AZ103]|uniref:hypothetical protein n=1 Tax=Enterococcus sp. AZ103 TaxID=2774628 RepID=UPI003F201132